MMNVLRANSFLLSLAAMSCGVLGWTAQNPAYEKLGSAAPVISAGAYATGGILGIFALMGVVAVLKQRS
ncbi:MAG: hypothetical protein HUU55_18105 [Myxococcales bacterium]|nr:hypothetical protein [Myxococcales bacterium]